jgi:hypothetical protein
MSLLQVSICTPDGKCVETIEGMKLALEGSEYSLDQQETEDNDMIAVVTTASEEEAERLMEIGEIILPSGCKMEVESH